MQIPSRLRASFSRSLLLVVLLALVPGAASVASASPITVYVTGTVIGRQTGVFAGQGTTVSASLTYDLGLLPSTNDPDLNSFASNQPFNAGFADFDATVTNGAVTRTADDFASELGFGKDYFFTLQDNASLDEIEFTGFGQVIAGVAPNDSITYNWVLTVVLRDTDPRPPVGLAPGSDNLTGQLVDLSQIDLAEFEVRYGSLEISGYNPPGSPINSVGKLDFSIDSISLVPVPEPASGLLVSLGLIGLAVQRRLR